MAKILSASYIRSLIKPRKKDSYKGDYGHVLVLAGSRGMTGAAVLCAGAVLRSGAGLVTVGVPESQHHIIASNLRPEAMTLALHESPFGTLSGRSFSQIEEFVIRRKITTIVAGPGLGINKEILYIILKILSSFRIPVVLDADGISILAGNIEKLFHAKARVIITPHMGEFSHLVKIPALELQKKRERVAMDFAGQNGVTCVLKGYRTIISDGSDVFINTTGNPGMATGGSGDVLAGMIGALTCQMHDPVLLNAAVSGAYLHGLAGDIAALNKTQIGLLAGDIIDAIPDALRIYGK